MQTRQYLHSLECDSARVIALLFQLHALCSKGQVLLGYLEGIVYSRGWVSGCCKYTLPKTNKESGRYQLQADQVGREAVAAGSSVTCWVP